MISMTHPITRLPDSRLPDAAISRSSRRACPRLRRRDGDDALREGRVHQQELRRAEPARSPSSSARCTRSTSAPAPTSSRPTPSAPTASSSGRSAWPTGCARSTSRARGSRARAARRARLRRRRDRPARHPHRAVGQDRRRRGARVLPRAGAGARSRAASTSSSSRRSATSTRSARRSTPCARVSRPADRRADDDRGGRQHARRHAARAVRARARAARRDRHRRQLRRRPGADARDDRADGGGHASCGCRRSRTPASRATSRGATSTCARPSTWRRTRGASSCTTCGSSAAAAARRPSTSGRSRRRSGRWRRPSRVARRRRRAGSRGTAGRADAAPQRRRRSPRARSRGSRDALARGTFVIGVELLPPRGLRRRSRSIERARAAEDARRRRRQHSRRPARRRAHERAVAGGADRAAGRDRDAAPLLLPRPQPARHPVRPARRARDGAAQPDAHHRRSRAASATIPDATAVFDVDSIGLTNVVSRLNHGCDVGGQPIGAPTAFHIGVSVNPGGVEPRRGAAAVRVQGRGGRRVRRDAAGLRRRGVRALPEAHRVGAAAGRRRRLAVRERAQRRVHGQRSAGRARAGGAARADAARRRRRTRPRPRASRSRARSRRRCEAVVQGLQVSTPSGNIDAALAVVDGLR